jgi:hypothetical protein
MEAAVLLGVLGVGYLLNNNENTSNNNGNNNNNNNNDNVDLPLKADAYSSNYFEQSDEEHKKQIFESYEKSKVPGANIVNYQNINKYLDSEIVDPDGDENYIYSNSAGAKILKENFLVNDQGIKLSPYFKKAPANINLDDSNVNLRRHQGSPELKTRKTEQPSFFQPFKQEVFGKQFEGDLLQSKYVTSKINNNVLPFEQQMVQPIDDKTSVIGDINRQYYEKSKTENIRTLNNQKDTYEGRVLAGSKHSKRGKIGQVFEHTPMTDYFNSADKWLTTTGAYTAEMERPEQILPNTNRQFFNKQEFGPATGIDHESQMNRPKFALSNKQTFSSDTIRNAGTSVGQMNNEEVMNSTIIYPNERDVTTLRTYDGNLKPDSSKSTLGIQDDVKNTKKQTTINPANNGYLTGTDLPTERLYDNVKNTKKQHTTFDENYVGVGGTTVAQPINEEQYKNAETNATKEIIAQGRYPTPEGDKYTNSVETYNIEIKKDEQDYFNHRQTHYDRMNTEYLPKNTCNFTQFKNKLDDSSIGSMDGGRIDPSLLTPFKDNPYTQSLSSFVY